MNQNNERDGGGFELIGRERMHGSSRAIAEGTAPEQVTEEQIAQVAADVESFRRAYKIDSKTIAENRGYSESVISEFLKGKYPASGSRVAIDLDSWLVEETEKRSRASTTQFTRTNVAMLLKATANYCLDHQSIGLAYGPQTSGIGKSISLQAYYEELGPRRCALVRLDKVDASPTGLLKKIASAMKIDGPFSVLRKFNKIVDRLKGRSHILLVDQIHNLRFAKNDKPLYMLADLHDATKTAQLWTGTSDIVAYLDRQRMRNVDESLAQIRRRIFPCIDILEAVGPANGGAGAALFTVEQIREVFAKNQLRITSAAARFLTKLCNTPDSGSLGLAERLVEYATMLAGTAAHCASEIDTPLLLLALRCCVSSARADLVIRDIEETPVTAVARAG